MSIVIGVCGRDFCTLFSDNWNVLSDDSGRTVHTASAKKVFRINDQLILGTTGVFDTDEDICGPVRILENSESLRLTDAGAALIQFMDQDHVRLQACEHRNYLLGGINLHGQLCMWHLHFNAKLGYTEISTCQPDSSHRYATLLSLPFSRPDQQQYWINRVHYATLNCSTQDELVSPVTRIIQDLHAANPATGDQIQYQTILRTGSS